MIWLGATAFAAFLCGIGYNFVNHRRWDRNNAIHILSELLFCAFWVTCIVEPDTQMWEKAIYSIFILHTLCFAALGMYGLWLRRKNPEALEDEDGE